MPTLHVAPAPISRHCRLHTLENALVELDRLARAPDVMLSPGWDLSHTLDHCARSIEHSMRGFPTQNSVLFQRLIGATAFHLFEWRGYMKHNLLEEIPGDVFTPPPPTLDTAIARLQRSIRAFLDYQGPLSPHFAYGALSHAEYDRANAMHIANHFDAMEF